MTIPWDPALETGITEIDLQHRELFARIDQLLEAMKEGRGRDEVGNVLRFLDAYVVEHFGAEERLMRARAYPQVEAHARQHRQFEADLEDLAREVERGGTGTLLVIRVNRQVLDWLRTHILGNDRAFATWLSTAPRTISRAS